MIPRSGVCQCCGQSLPRDFLFVGSDIGLPVRGKQAQILDAVMKAGTHGIDPDRLFDLLYADDPNGGPDVGNRIVSIHINALNKRLVKVGKRIKGQRGRDCYYRLVDL